MMTAAVNPASIVSSWAQQAAAALDKPPASLPVAAPKPTLPPVPKIAPATVKAAPPDDVQARILQNLGKAKPPAKAAAGYQVLSPSDVLSSPLVRDLVKGIFPCVGVGGIIGASMAGKGFIAFDVMAVLAEGGWWFGYRTDKVPVLYVCLEGAGGLHKRIRAWEKKNGRKYPDIGIVAASFNLRDPAQVEALIAAIRAAGFAGGVIVLDTLAQAAVGADENSSRDMGELLAALQAIQAALGGLVLVVHHLGKDTARGARGHSSFTAALDASIEVRREGDRRSWVVAKVKDDSDGAEHFFRLEVIEVGQDDDGDLITSCVVVPDDDAKTATRSKLPKGGNQRIVYDALGEHLRESKNSGKAGAPAGRPCVELETAVAAIAPRLVVEEKRRAERVRLALTGLIAGGIVICREGWLWLP